MKKENLKELLRLIDQENKYRDQWRKIRTQLEKLVPEITAHNRYCNDFWSDHLKENDEIITTSNKGEKILIKRPIRESASCESYLPFSLDYKVITYLELKD